MKEKIVITGMGAVTPVGIGVENYWSGLRAGCCGIGPITGIPTQGLSVSAAGEVRDFVPRDHLNVRMAADLDRFMQFAYVAAEEALEMSGLSPAGNDTGIVMGTALAGLSLIGQTQQDMAEGSKVSPRFLSKVMGNIAAAQLAIAHGIKGPSLTVSTACSSGGDAITLAAMLLQARQAEAMVVMAGESAVSPLVINSLTKAGALSKSGRSKPFDVDRDGFVVGEGGGALILETERHALARGAEILAEVCGCANNNDAYHTVSPEPEGDGAAECMYIALNQANLSPADIGYVNAHGTATAAGDIAETRALLRVFGDCAVPVSSTKGATGHMMGAGGITETIACVKALQTGILPVNIGMDTRAPECPLNIVTADTRPVEIRYAMSNALGFGGQNSSIITGKYTRE